MDDQVDVYNWPALAVGSSAMFACLAIQGIVVILLMTQINPRMHRLIGQNRKISAHSLFCCAILALLVSHLAQMYVWAIFLYSLGIMENPHKAVLFAGSTYTTVGFITDALPMHWQLLGVIMATTGLFAFAWSTSTMFALSKPLYKFET